MARAPASTVVRAISAQPSSSARYAVERRCTCKGGQRSAECGRVGWHHVDGHDTLGAAAKDAETLEREVGVAYRVIDTAHH